VHAQRRSTLCRTWPRQVQYVFTTFGKDLQTFVISTLLLATILSYPSQTFFGRLQQLNSRLLCIIHFGLWPDGELPARFSPIAVSPSERKYEPYPAGHGPSKNPGFVQWHSCLPIFSARKGTAPSFQVPVRRPAADVGARQDYTNRNWAHHIKFQN
jgi:hypothetical protein